MRATCDLRIKDKNTQWAAPAKAAIDRMFDGKLRGWMSIRSLGCALRIEAAARGERAGQKLRLEWASAAQLAQRPGK